MKLYSEEEVREIARRKIGYGYTQTDMARDAGISRSLVCLALNGKVGLGIAVPKLVGMKRVVAYVREND